jgi:hypothetical protein
MVDYEYFTRACSSVFRVLHEDGGRKFLENSCDHMLTTWYHIIEARALGQSQCTSSLVEAVSDNLALILKSM